ncbi:hypothetical protein O181_060219 [Austropuccinia psidii MF-1]|uniref:ClpX, ATPase regulatory subunit n=1 Tax=Austropuccinia psidii MF-1 TaxID=1389203 RepID=A0A9Q3EFW4_9BASI|nr:hypothetical protein [Austropuccinia psidii MF-1]
MSKTINLSRYLHNSSFAISASPSSIFIRPINSNFISIQHILSKLSNHSRTFTNKRHVDPLLDLSQLPNPRQIHQELDNYVISQANAKKILSVAVFNHYVRIRALAEANEKIKAAEDVLVQSNLANDQNSHDTVDQSIKNLNNLQPHNSIHLQGSHQSTHSNPKSTSSNPANKIPINPKALEASLKLERHDLEARLGQSNAQTISKKTTSFSQNNHKSLKGNWKIPFLTKNQNQIPVLIEEKHGPKQMNQAHRYPIIFNSSPPFKHEIHSQQQESIGLDSSFKSTDPSKSFENSVSGGSSSPQDLFDSILTKSNILLLGPTGSGKSLLARTLARKLNVPYSESCATTFTQAGYVGEDVESAVVRLYQESNNDPEKTSRGIIFIDEIDKIARRSADGFVKDVSGEGVQQAMLRMLEGTLVTVSEKGNPNESILSTGRSRDNHQHTGKPGQPVQVDTSNILFILAGAFVGLEKIIQKRISKVSIGFNAALKPAPFEARLDSPSADQVHSSRSNIEDSSSLLNLTEPADLNAFGLIPEFIGRIPILASLKPLTEEDLLRVLTEPKNCLLKQYERLFEMNGVKIKFTTGAIRAIATLASHKKTGARGLKQIMETFLLESMYVSPQSSIKYILISESVVKGQSLTQFYSRGQEDLMKQDFKRAEESEALVCHDGDKKLNRNSSYFDRTSTNQLKAAIG